MTHEPTLELEPTLIRAHYSALTAHRECPSRWHYRYVLRVKSPEIGPKPEMHFGSWWGVLTAAEGLARGRKLDSLKAEPGRLQGPDDSPEFDARTVTPREVLEAAIAWWKEREPETKEAWVDTLGEPLPHRLKHLYLRWMDEHAEERKNELPLGFEVFWRRLLPRPEGDDAWEGQGGKHLDAVELIGYIDEVYFDKARGFVVVRDRKSHKVLKPATSLSDMMDSQLQLYAWGGQEVIESWGHGPVRAVSYDRARSVAPKSPEITKTAGSLSKGVTDYDVATYRTFAATDTRPVDDLRAMLLEKEERLAAVDVLSVTAGETQDQIDHLKTVLETPGQFWGELGYFVSGPRKAKPKFGVYAEDPKVVAALSTPVAKSIWFQRTRPPVNVRIIDAHLRAALDTATDAWRTQQRVEITGEAGRNLGKACEWCDYASICRDRMVGGAAGEYDLNEHNLVAPEGRSLLINGRLEHNDRVIEFAQEFAEDLA